MKRAVAAFLAACTVQAEVLCVYDFDDRETASQVDATRVVSGVRASDLSEYGDPDGGGTSPQLTKFSGTCLNIKRNSINSSLEDHSSYLEFTLNAGQAGGVLRLSQLNLRIFQQTDPGFSLAVYADTGSGFVRYAMLPGEVRTQTVNPLDLRAVPAAFEIRFRIEFAHPEHGPGNTTLQLKAIGVEGVVEKGFVILG